MRLASEIGPCMRSEEGTRVTALRAACSCCAGCFCLTVHRMCVTTAYSRVLPCMELLRTSDPTSSRGAYGPLRQCRGQRTGAENCGRGRGCRHYGSTSWQRCGGRRQIGRRCAKAGRWVWSGGQWREWGWRRRRWRWRWRRQPWRRWFWRQVQEGPRVCVVYLPPSPALCMPPLYVYAFLSPPVCVQPPAH
eukprot:COSAG02_NODE_1418_length_12720_cov_20.079629_12_plen_191_part_00